MVPVYKLTYFDIPALGEPIRYLFAYGNIAFEDVRIKHDKEWPGLKPKTPFGQVPILEYDGKIIGQSVPITKYVAKLVELSGKDAWEDFEIDSIVDTYIDLKMQARYFSLEQDEGKKAEKKKILEEETIPFYMQRFEQQVNNNNGYFVGGRLTWADIYITLLLAFMEQFLDLKVFTGYPATKKLYETVISNENYQKWLKTVPSS